MSDSAGEINITEEDRSNHMHILGTTREGKSKFLEMLLQGDIDGGFGATLLDPSDNGATCYDVLRYCMKKNYHKVCLIDPHDYATCIPTINPLKWKGAGATDAVVANLMESVQVLWGQTGFENTPRIATYLEAIFTVLYATGNPDLGKERLACTIPDAIAFSVKDNLMLNTLREKILSCSHKYDDARLKLEEVFHANGKQTYLYEYISTTRRLAPFFKYLPKRIFGSSDTCIDFRQMVSENWIILVNLDKTRLWGTPQQRILGTLVINEIVNAVMDLRANSWQGKHYLYIDEAGQYSTRVLADIMAYKGKSGLWATLSHQFYNQFEDKYVLDAVENLCKFKVMFSVPNTADRNRMLRDMYTGQVKEEAVDSYLSLKKQNCVIKVDKQPPIKTHVRDVETPEYTGREVEAFKNSVIYTNSWYRTTEGVQQEINQRFAKGKRPATQQPSGGKPERTERDSDTRADPQPGNDQHSDVEARPVDEGGDFQLPRRRHRQDGVQPTLVHKSEQDAEPLGVPRAPVKRTAAPKRQKARTPKETPNG
jgi:hypothetical protein